MARGRKLYYDVVLTGPSASLVVPLTQVTDGTLADRNGAYLDALPGLLGTAEARAKQAQEVAAYFVPYSVSLGATIPVLQIQFLRNGTDLAPYYTAGGAGITSVPTKAGSSAAYVTDPRARIRHQAAVGAARVIRGTLYIQRQHSIEC